MTLVEAGADVADIVLTTEFEVIRKPAPGQERGKGPSSWQMSWLFERVHQSEVIAARAVLARQASPNYHRIAASRQATERWLRSDPYVPCINHVLYENPLRVRKIIAGVMAAGAMAGALQYTFHETAGAIEGAAEVVHAANDLRTEIDRFGQDDPNEDTAERALAGEGREPEIKLIRIEAHHQP